MSKEKKIEPVKEEAIVGKLFCQGDFTLHGKQNSWFKIDCDALCDGDIDTLARVAKDLLPPFYRVAGIPSGGLRFAKALEAYETPSGVFLIADDVYTTGTSMESYRGQLANTNPYDNPEVIGITIFSRNMVMLPWVSTIFKMYSLQPNP